MTRVAIIGASGYTGAELIRLCLQHPRLQITGVYARTQAGEPLGKQFPQFAGIDLSGHPARHSLAGDASIRSAHLAGDRTLESYDCQRVAQTADVAFLALPHGEAAAIARELVAAGVKVLDLSADFRLRSIDVHKKWYGEHHAPELIGEARYGLVERHRGSLKGARLIAVPGCYPTATLLALAPLLDAHAIEPRDIIVDAKSGVSGAGRGLSRASLFCEAAGGVRAYKVAEHRHTPEIEQELSRAHGSDVTITFTPHLIPMIRGIVSTCYALPTQKRPRQSYLDLLRAAYENEPFVTVVDHPPDSAHLCGSNRVHVSVFVDDRSGRVIAIGAIDNLVKGAAGQALQGLNAMMGWPETEGLAAIGVFP